MKLPFLVIAFFLFLSEVYAQEKINAPVALFEWKGRDPKFRAEIQIYSAVISSAAKKKLPVAYFIGFKHEPENASAVFNAMLQRFADSLPCTAVYVSFINNLIRDTSDAKHVKEFAAEIFSGIQPALEKNFPDRVKHAGIVITGLNDAAVIALFASVEYRTKVAGTGLFFIDYYIPERFAVKETYFSASAEGKVFMYVSGNNIQNQNASALADNIALSSSMFVYKIEEDKFSKEEDLFFEMYNWMRADGNNYIIKTD